MKLFTVAAALALLPLVAPAAADPSAPIDFRWTIEPIDGQSGEVQFLITRHTANSRWTYSDTTPLAEIVGLTAEQLASSADRPVRFRLARAAGTFDCDGIARRGSGSGHCRFQADTRFAAELSRRRIGPATDNELFQMSLGGVDLAFLDETERQRYARPTVADLIQAANHGVDLDYLRDMGRLGYRAGTIGALVQMRDHGVTPAYVDGFAAAGYRTIPADDLVAMRDHGVTPDYVRTLAQHGIRDLPTAELIRLRDHGVDAGFVGRVRRLGYGHGVDDLIRMRNHGVSADYLSELVSLGYSGLTPDEIVRLREHGIDGAFIRRANAGGRRSAEELVRLRTGG